MAKHIDTSKVETTIAGTPPPETELDVKKDFPTGGWVVRWKGDDGVVYQNRARTLTAYLSVVEVRVSDDPEEPPRERWLQLQVHHKSRVLERRELFELKETFLGNGQRAVELYEETLPNPAAAQLWRRLDGPTVVPDMPGPDALKNIRDE